MKLTDRTNIKTVADVKAGMLRHNELVKAWDDAMNWLTDVTKDKLDKKATKAILTKWQTEFTSGHCEQRYLNNGYGWEIMMGDSPYKTNECNMIFINACEESSYTNGERYLKPAKDFYTGRFEYPKGATWSEVLECIHKYAAPKSYQIDDYYLERTHDNLENIVKEMRELEHYDWEHYKTNGYYLNNWFIDEQ